MRPESSGLPTPPSGPRHLGGRGAIAHRVIRDQRNIQSRGHTHAGNTVSVQYDGNGNMTRFTGPRGAATATTFAYDAKNRLSTRTDVLTRLDTFGYRGDGNGPRRFSAGSRSEGT